MQHSWCTLLPLLVTIILRQLYVFDYLLFIIYLFIFSFLSLLAHFQYFLLYFLIILPSLLLQSHFRVTSFPYVYSMGRFHTITLFWWSDDWLKALPLHRHIAATDSYQWRWSMILCDAYVWLARPSCRPGCLVLPRQLSQMLFVWDGSGQVGGKFTNCNTVQRTGARTGEQH